MSSFIQNYTRDGRQNVFIIVVDGDVTKWNQVKKVFTSKNLNLIKVDATVGADRNQKVYNAHKLILKTILDNSITENVLVLEETAILTKELSRFEARFNLIKLWLDNKNQDWDFFNGGYRVKRAEDRITTDSVSIEGHVHKNYFLKLTGLNVIGTTMIYYNNSSIRKILDDSTYGTWGEFIQRFNGLYCFPFLTSESFIGDGLNYFKLYKNTLVQLKKVVLVELEDY